MVHLLRRLALTLSLLHGVFSFQVAKVYMVFNHDDRNDFDTQIYTAGLIVDVHNYENGQILNIGTSYYYAASPVLGSDSKGNQIYSYVVKHIHRDLSVPRRPSQPSQPSPFPSRVSVGSYTNMGRTGRVTVAEITQRPITRPDELLQFLLQRSLLPPATVWDGQRIPTSDWPYVQKALLQGAENNRFWELSHAGRTYMRMLNAALIQGKPKRSLDMWPHETGIEVVVVPGSPPRGETSASSATGGRRLQRTSAFNRGGPSGSSPPRGSWA